MRHKTFIKLKQAIAVFTLVAFFIQPSILAFASETTATPDPNQGKNPGVEQTANGTTVINIREPNRNGLSHNQFLDLQVGPNGIIFNNSSNISNTQLAGYINGNSYAGPGGAKVILNEVTGHLPSHLNGYMEVAGNRADLIIANPNGIVGSNFGFINTNKATLTTGVPQINNGSLNGFVVNSGNIIINGQGMDATRASKTDIIANAVQINAAVNAQDLQIITGNNQVNYQTGEVTVLDNTPSGISLDVSALGGMYANRIQLVGTRRGVGVNSVGSISAVEGNIILTQEGKIILAGTTYAKNDIKASSQDSIVQQGILYAKGNMNLLAGQNIDNSGTVQADNNLNLKATGNITNTDKIGANQNLTITANTLNNQNAVINNMGTGNLNITAGTVNNTGGKLLSDGSTIFNTTSIANTNGLIYSQSQTQITSTSLTGDGQILSTGDINLQLQNSFVNTGTVQANGSVTLSSQGNITNQQDILAGSNITLTATGNITNQLDIQANNNIAMNASNIDNQAQGKVIGSKVTVNSTNTLDNTGLINANNTNLTANTLNNTATGRIYGNHVSIQASVLNNIGNSSNAPVIAARSRLDIGAQTITNKDNALLLAEGDVYIGGSLDNNGNATGTADLLNNNSATVEAGNNLTINADTINNTNDHFRTELEVVDSEYVVEYQGAGQSKKYLAGTTGVWIYNDESDHLRTPEGRFSQWNAYRYTITKYQHVIKETTPGKLISGQNMFLNSQTLTNDKSQIVSGSNMFANIGTLNNIEAEGKTIFVSTGTLTSYWRHHQSGRDRTGSSVANYRPANTDQDIIVLSSTYAQNQVPISSGQDASNLNQQDNSGSIGDQNGLQITIPPSSLNNLTNDPDASYFIETDPNYTNFKQWASSDYFFNLMQYDADKILKRLGDAYYEQKLIKEQIMSLTGNRYLAGNTSDDEQYKLLMENAVTFAKNSEAVVGVALTYKQIGELKDNIVWMIEKEVLLPNGEIVKALVPQVYIIDGQDKNMGSTVISAKNIDFNITNEILNSGTIQVTNNVEISATNINNIGGSIKGSEIQLTATEDINNIGGSILADNSINMNAGRDINIESTTSTQDNAQGSTTNLSAIGLVQVTNEDNGTINMQAGNDINLKAAAVINQGKEGNTTLVAENNINLETVEISESNNLVWDSNNKRKDHSTTDVGTNIYTAGDLTLQAGNDLNAKAATVTSDKGITVEAGNDINIEAGRETSNIVEDHKYTGKSGGGNKMKITTHDKLQEDLSIGSTFSGGTVSMKAGNDLDIKASSVVATNDVNLNADNDINITTEIDSTTQVHNKTVKKTGIMSGGGFGFFIGSKENKDNYTDKSAEQVGSTIGSLDGNVNINAGNDVNIKASDIIANENINIEGDHVTIESADSQYTSYEKHEYKQSGLTVSLSGGVLDVINNIYQPLQRSSEASDDRLKVVSAIKGGHEIYKGINTIGNYATNLKTYQDVLAKSNGALGQGAFGAGGKDVKPSKPDNGFNNISLDVSFGTSKSVSETNSTTVIAEGSNISAGGNVTIKAREKDIDIKGSTIDGENITLHATGDVNITASANANASDTDSKSSSTSFGVGINLGSGGLTGSLSIYKHKGEILENGVTWNESVLTAKDKLVIETGKDLNIIGSQVAGGTVEIEVGGNLNIESLQDTDNYHEKNTSGGLNLNLAPKVPSISGNVSNQNIDSEYTSVNEQAGIFAGNGGFDINVGGNTDLKGSVISSQADEDKNKLSTETITFSDIENKAEWDSETKGVGVAVGKGTSDKDKGLTPITAGSEGEADSTTNSAISPGEIEVRSDEGKAEEDKTDLSELSRDPETANNPLDKIFDRDKVLEREEAAALFGELGFTLVGDIADRMDWKEGSPEKIALHALVGGIMAEINDGSFGEGMTVGAINELLIAELSKLKGKDNKPLVDNDVMQLVSSIVGKAIGGNSGAGIAENATKNNWLTHKEVADMQAALDDCGNNKTCRDEVTEDYQELSKDRDNNGDLMPTDGAWSISFDSNGNVVYHPLNTQPPMTLDQLKKAATTTGSALIIVGGIAYIGGQLYVLAGGAPSSIATGTTGTVWELIKPTATNISHTVIPATFQLQIGQRILWVNSNATKHMGDYVSRFFTSGASVQIRSQAVLTSFNNAVYEASAIVSTSPAGRHFLTVGGWELGINTETGVIYHALMK